MAKNRYITTTAQLLWYCTACSFSLHCGSARIYVWFFWIDKYASLTTIQLSVVVLNTLTTLLVLVERQCNVLQTAIFLDDRKLLNWVVAWSEPVKFGEERCLQFLHGLLFQLTAGWQYKYLYIIMISEAVMQSGQFICSLQAR